MKKVSVLLAVVLSPLGMAGGSFSVSHLKTHHPLVLASGADFERLREGPLDQDHGALLRFLQSAGDSLLEEEPVRYKKEGVRLLSESRKVLKRLSILGLLYRLHGDSRYLKRAIRELEAVLAFPDWNPSHFLDTGEMTLAVAIGADWLWDDLPWGLGERIQQALLEKGISPSLDEEANGNWWITTTDNWSPVGHAGMVAGALLLAEREPAIAETMINRALENVPMAMAETDPDGIYPEGPMYWQYGTAFTAILIELLEKATGRDYGLGSYPSFQRSIAFRVMTVGPTGQFYNFSDSGSEVSNSPVVSWFASRFGNPLAYYEHQRLLRAFLENPGWQPGDHRHRLLGLQALWFPSENQFKKAVDEALPKIWHGSGSNPLSIVRSGWGEEAFYFACKGGSASLNHSHEDAGSFVFEDEGVRWAVDLGQQDYHSLESHGLGIWDKRQHSDRWRVFRLGPYSHNLLLIDEQPQQVDGRATMTVSEERPGVVETRIDLSEVYAGQVERYVRSIKVHDLKLLQFTETIQGARARESSDAMDAATLHWRMVTGARIEIHGNEAVLTQDGKQLHVRVVSPERVRLRATALDPAPYFWDAPNPGKSALDLWSCAEQDGSQTLTIILSTDRGAVETFTEI